MAFTLAETLQKKASPLAMQLALLARRMRVGPLFRWRFNGFCPYEILAVPLELRPQDVGLARSFYNGCFPLAGRIIETGSASPFSVLPPTQAWHDALQSFSWLRHLSTGNNRLAAAHARSLIQDWLVQCKKPISGTAWRADIVAARLMSWFCHVPFLFQDAPQSFIKEFMRSIGFQVRYLVTAAQAMPENEKALKAYIGLSFCALCISLGAKEQQSIFQQLEYHLNKQIFPDGGHVSRSPVILLDILSDLIALRQTFVSRNKRPPYYLVAAIERMFPALRFFLHRDGSFAHFNGSTPLVKLHLKNVLSWDDSEGEPFVYAPHSGYQRLSFGPTTLIADIGNTPEPQFSHHAHAGCLSFEMSCGQHRFITNTGVDPFGLQENAFLGRLTPAHSTATLNNSSSCVFKKSLYEPSMLISRGAKITNFTLIEGPEREGFIGSHDGYAQSENFIHERGIILTTNGKRISGFDRFFPVDTEKPLDANTEVAIRFHLHPDIQISHDMNGHIKLQSLSGDVWTFFSKDVPAKIEESVYFADPKGPRRTRQIVLQTYPMLQEKIHWSLTYCA